MQALVACTAAGHGSSIEGVLPALVVAAVALFAVVSLADHYRGGGS
ncbi:hypothetical protein J2754_000739 [Halarchaeum solikamskense]|nr:hypothetical protein [Halarchaeum solikamskense]MBP2250442.1 hypothetical protein [Halarchaeum solikamskense]